MSISMTDKCVCKYQADIFRNDGLIETILKVSYYVISEFSILFSVFLPILIFENMSMLIFYIL